MRAGFEFLRRLPPGRRCKRRNGEDVLPKKFAADVLFRQNEERSDQDFHPEITRSSTASRGFSNTPNASCVRMNAEMASSMGCSH